MIGRVLSRGVGTLRRADTWLSRRDGRRRVLVNARTPVNFRIFAPVYRLLRSDPRLEIFFTASDEPQRTAQIYHEAGDVPLVTPARAALMKFDAYLASDFMWTALPRGTCRIQTFHGVGGKYGFDVPDRSMRDWHRLFFINERRLRNFIAAGAITPDSPAIRLVGMPKVDCLVNGSLQRDDVLRSLDLDPARPTVLYAPTWSPASSLNAMGLDLVRSLLQRPINVIVKLHDRSRDLRQRYSGGVDWVAALQPLMQAGRSVVASGHDICPYLAASDLMITDHSSAGFEFLLLDRPLVRIHRPALLELAKVHADYVSLLESVSQSTESLEETLEAVDRGLGDPARQSSRRREVAADLFYRPGTAAARTAAYLYEAICLEPVPAVLTAQEAPCHS
jgi:hypothetical protein